MTTQLSRDSEQNNTISPLTSNPTHPAGHLFKAPHHTCLGFNPRHGKGCVWNRSHIWGWMRLAVENANTGFCMEARTHGHRITRPVKKGHRCLFSLPSHLPLGIPDWAWLQHIYMLDLCLLLCLLLKYVFLCMCIWFNQGGTQSGRHSQIKTLNIVSDAEKNATKNVFFSDDQRHYSLSINSYTGWNVDWIETKSREVFWSHSNWICFEYFTMYLCVMYLP